MLEEVLRHLNNWFLVPDGIHSGEFIVQDGLAHAALSARWAVFPGGGVGL